MTSEFVASARIAYGLPWRSDDYWGDMQLRWYVLPPSSYICSSPFVAYAFVEAIVVVCRTVKVSPWFSS